MSRDIDEFWIDDYGAALLLDTYRRRGEQAISDFIVEDDGSLVIVTVNDRRIHVHTRVPAGHWWDHEPSEEELETPIPATALLPIKIVDQVEILLVKKEICV